MTFNATPGFLSADDCRLADLIDLVSQKTDPADYSYAQAVQQNVLIYDGGRLRTELSRPAGRRRVESELARALSDGPGIVVLARAFDDPWVIDRATWQFEAIIAAQRAAGRSAGDHFAAAGQNDRIWNALEKLALRAPEVFADYYANDLIAAMCRAWLGPGYLAWQRPEFGEYFETHHVQLPLAKGDAVFFNTALFHAAGANRSANVNRMANLLQISSAFGRAMEAVDRAAMSAAVAPALQAMADDGASPAAIANVIAACAEGYPFPANLDLDQPAGGLMPPTQADILSWAVAQGWSRQQLETELGAWTARRQTRRPT